MDKKGWMYIRMDRTEEAFNAVIKNKYDMRWVLRKEVQVIELWEIILLYAV